MTFVPTTPPGPISGATPLVFTCSEPTNISLRFYPLVEGVAVPGSWDVVYGGCDSSGANGSVSDLYTGHVTRVGNTWTITPPAGVWPAQVRVWADEAIGGSVAVGYHELYSIDFRELSDQALGLGPNTIAGKTWWGKGSIDTAGGESVAIVHGAGLRIRTYSAASPGYHASDLNGLLAMYLPLDQLDGYSAEAPCILQARWKDMTTDAYVSNIIGYTSLFSCAKDASYVKAAERVGGNVGYYGLGAGDQGTFTYADDQHAQAYFNTGFGVSMDSIVYTTGILGVANGTYGSMDPSMSGNSGAYGPRAWPDPARTNKAWTAFYAGCTYLDDPYSAHPSLGACVWGHGLGPSFGVQQFTLAALRVLQTKGAA